MCEDSCRLCLGSPLGPVVGCQPYIIYLYIRRHIGKQLKTANSLSCWIPCRVGNQRAGQHQLQLYLRDLNPRCISKSA